VLCLHLPNTLKAVDRNVTGGKLSVKGKKLGHYLFFQKNPIVLVSPQKTRELQTSFLTAVFRFFSSSSSPAVLLYFSTMVLIACHHLCYSQPRS
jgi:hypothetical protein